MRIRVALEFPLLAALLVATAGAHAAPPSPHSREGGETVDAAAPLLEALLPGTPDRDREVALRGIAESRDKRFIAPLIDLVRFAPTRGEFGAYLDVLHVLIDDDVALFDPWRLLTVWYGEHPELKPPPGYVGWKGELHARLFDPRFREILYPYAPAAVRVEEVVWGGVPVDGIAALVNPKMIAADAAAYAIAAEPVFGVSLKGDSRAYPLRILDWHEMANDVVGGRHVALTYCTLCGAGILFDSTVGGTTYEFGSSGFLFRSNKLMYDRQTKTLWNQLTGEPVIGRLVGEKPRLKILPVVLTSWGEWRREHPDTKILDIHTGYSREYRLGEPYGQYFASPETMFPVWRQDARLANKERIFAVVLDGRPKAYPLDALNRAGGVVNDTIGAARVVVVSRAAVGKVALPKRIVEALEKRGGPDSRIAFANDLSLRAARAVLAEDPSLASEMTAEVLLAMPTEARLNLLSERPTDERHGSSAAPGLFAPDLRNEVAARGLIGETRAYDRGAHTFSSSPSPDRLLDERRRAWRATEEALVGPDNARLPRLGGHLAYWFGWFAFYPHTEVYVAGKSS
jgi:Protein of unknown function (DUF3179)